MHKYLLLILLSFGFSNIDATTTDGKSVEVIKNDSYGWEVNQYVDDYGDFVGDKYVTNSIPIEGVFTNSATTNSLLNVKILIHEKSIDFMLFEYGTQRVKDTQSIDIFRIGLKHNGELIYNSGFNKFPFCAGDISGDRVRVKNKIMKIDNNIDNLKMTLQELINNENYESAAIIRDRIEEISNKK